MPVPYASLLFGIGPRMIPPGGAPMPVAVPLMALAVWGLGKYRGGAEGIVPPIIYVIAASIITGLALILA